MVYKAKSQKKIQGHWRVHSHWYEHKLVIMNGLNWKHNQVEGNGYVTEQGRWSGSEYNGNYWNFWCSIKSGEFIMCNLFGFSTVSLNRNSHVTFLIQSGISNITKTEI